MGKRPIERPPSDWQLEQMLTTLLSARAQLLAEDANIESDEVLYHDMIDGESGNALDILDETMRVILGYEDMVELAERRAEIILSRAKLWQSRADRLRGIVHAAFEAGGLSRRSAADLTATMKEGKGHVEITDEKLIPPQYKWTREYVMKAEIGERLRAGDKVPGAVLSNKMPFIQIRSR